VAVAVQGLVVGSGAGAALLCLLAADHVQDGYGVAGE
jgi:hypothetical protein